MGRHTPRGAITTTLEERINQLLGELAREGRIEPVLPQILRALIEAIEQMEDLMSTPVPLHRALQQTIETLGSPDHDPNRLTHPLQIRPESLPQGWVQGINKTQHILKALAHRVQAAPGHRIDVPITITGEHHVLIDNIPVGHLTNTLKDSANQILATLNADRFTTYAKLTHSREGLWCLKLGDPRS